MYRAILVFLAIALLSVFGLAVFSNRKSPETKIESEVTDGPIVSGDYQRRLDAAIQSFREGGDTEAMDEIRRLSAMDPPFLPAHRFMIEHLIELNRERRDLSGLRQLVHHLEIVSATVDEESKLVLGRLCAVMGKREEAIELLDDVLASYPEVGVMLSQMLLAQGDESGAKRVAKNAVAVCRDRLKLDSADLKSRLTLADNLGELGQFAEAVEVIREGKQTHPGLGGLLGDFLVKQSDSILEDRPLASFALLKEASNESPASPAPWIRLFVIANSDHATAANAALSFLTDSLEANGDNGILILVMGLHAYGSGEMKVALERLQEARRLLPHVPEATNAVALSLAKSDPPEIEPALKLLESVISAQPSGKKHLAVQGHLAVRGEIHLMAGEIQKAIEDYEAALEVSPGNRTVLESLLEIYEANEMPIKATVIRAKLDALNSQPAEDLGSMREAVKELERKLMLQA